VGREIDLRTGTESGTSSIFGSLVILIDTIVAETRRYDALTPLATSKQRSD